MTGMQWLLEAVLVLLLSATLFHAVRLERALGTLRRDRAALETLVASFNDSTRLAEDGVERLRVAADIAGKQIARQVDRANGLKEDLLFLTERGEKLADALERRVTDARQLEGSRPAPPKVVAPPTASETTPEPGQVQGRSRAERDLIRALRLGR